MTRKDGVREWAEAPASPTDEEEAPEGLAFDDAITCGANSVKKVRRRFEMMGSLFGEVSGAQSG